jgi:hypothetical protein
LQAGQGSAASRFTFGTAVKISRRVCGGVTVCPDELAGRRPLDRPDRPIQVDIA